MVSNELSVRKGVSKKSLWSARSCGNISFAGRCNPGSHQARPRYEREGGRYPVPDWW